MPNPRGRPKGFVPSPETRRRISSARLEQERVKREQRLAAPPPGEGTEEERAALERRCSGCHDPYDLPMNRVDRTFQVVRWGDGTLVPLCGFCRDTQTMMGGGVQKDPTP